jgi:sugar phosphate isomerase/epimerase
MPRAPFKMSFQLYTARHFQPQEAVLEGLAEIGYDAVEPWLPDYGDDPKAFRKRIDDAGLACLGFHMPFSGLVEETNRFIEIAHTIGDRPLMIPPYLQPHQRPENVDGWKRIGEQLAQGAERVKASGLRVAYRATSHCARGRDGRKSGSAARRARWIKPS